MKRTPLARKTPLKAKTGFKATKSTLRTKKSSKAKIDPSKRVINKGYKPPAWFMTIPVGSHGNSPTQKRYWKVISNFVRQRDFNKYNGRCVSCKVKLERWQDGQAAHFRAWGACNSYFKFHPDNCALSCSFCNHIDDGVIGHNFGVELKRRYGDKHLNWIEKENNKYRGIKLENQEIVERVEKLLEENPWFVLP